MLLTADAVSRSLTKQGGFAMHHMPGVRSSRVCCNSLVGPWTHKASNCILSHKPRDHSLTDGHMPALARSDGFKPQNV